MNWVLHDVRPRLRHAAGHAPRSSGRDPCRARSPAGTGTEPSPATTSPAADGLLAIGTVGDRSYNTFT